MTPVETWAESYGEVGVAPDWSYEPVALELKSVVTAMVTATAVVELGTKDGQQSAETRSRPEEVGQPGYAVWDLYHELELHWYFQDSLDGEKWFSAGSGKLNSSEPEQARRISAPIGLHARIAFRAFPVLAKVRCDNGSLEGRKFCEGELASCAVRHDEMRVRDLTFRALTRSI